jgi:hypothetical protein
MLVVVVVTEARFKVVLELRVAAAVGMTQQMATQALVFLVFQTQVAEAVEAPVVVVRVVLVVLEL